MNVALAVHHVRATGGQDRYALELLRRLASEVRIDLIAMIADGVPPEVRVHRVRPRVGPMLLRAEVFRRAARRVVARHGYDLVHTIGGALPGAHVVTAQFCHAAWAAVEPPRSAYQKLVVRRAIADERRAFGDRAVRAVVAVSRRTADELARYYGPLPVPATVIPNGVDVEAFAPAARPPLAGRPAELLFVGAYGRKGLDVAVRALAAMRRPAVLRAVGEGPRRHVERLAGELGVRDRVRCEPPRADIAVVFRAADAFVFPTRYEPFGMVIVEAMACGLPVVTSGVAGAAELITDGVSGRIVPDPEDAAGFAAALDAVLADDATASAMGRAARQAAQAVTWDRVAAETLAVWRSAASRP